MSDAPFTPWSPGAPPLYEQVRHRTRWPGWVPSRRQILAGYRDADTGVRVEGQVARAISALGEDATVDGVATHLAIWPGDVEFLEVVFSTLDARVVGVER